MIPTKVIGLVCVSVAIVIILIAAISPQMLAGVQFFVSALTLGSLLAVGVILLSVKQ